MYGQNNKRLVPCHKDEKDECMKTLTVLVTCREEECDTSTCVYNDNNPPRVMNPCQVKLDDYLHQFNCVIDWCHDFP